tara:strand:+ start:5749 stop:6108 length:360 start_codon:yes stop_codon:yes gene_type:complete
MGFKRFKILNNQVIDWAKDKGIFDKATPFSQHSKTLEEVEELSEAITAQYAGEKEFTNDKGELKNTDEEIQDAIGDILVTLIIQAKMQGLAIEQCLETAYNVISKRTGKMVDGVFVKDK